ARCSWNWHNIGRQAEQPGQSNFLRGDGVSGRDFRKHRIACELVTTTAAERTVSNHLYTVIATVFDYTVPEILIIEHAQADLHGSNLCDSLRRLDLADRDV